MAVSAGKGNRYVKKLMQQGFLQAHEINLGGRGGSIKFLELTDQGYKAIGMKPKAGIGKGAGFEHGFWQHHISEQAKGLPGVRKVMIEGQLMDKFIDILIEAENEKIGIEIAMNPDHEKINVEKDVAAGCSKVIIGCKDKLTLETVLKMVVDFTDDIKDRIATCLVQKVVEEIGKHLQTKGKPWMTVN